MIIVTGANGQLGRLVISHLLKRLPPEQIGAAVRNLDKSQDLKSLGIQPHQANYDEPNTLKAAFRGASKVLLISSSEVGSRTIQHQNAIDAAKSEGVNELVYTSILNASTSTLLLSEEHQQTEKYIIASGLSYKILRNGWYTENYLASLETALENGVIYGCASEGKISSAARTEYAEAAANVLLNDDLTQNVFELAGNYSYTLDGLAEIISKVSGKKIQYKDLPVDDYRLSLIKAGLPEPLANVLADSDRGAANGDLYSLSKDLSSLLSRSCLHPEELVKSKLRNLGLCV